MQLESRSWIRNSRNADVCVGRNFILKVYESEHHLMFWALSLVILLLIFHLSVVDGYKTSVKFKIDRIERRP